MSAVFRQVIVSTLVAASIAFWTSTVQAQQTQAEAGPALVVSVAGIDSLLADLDHLTQAAGTPQVGGLVRLMTGPYIEGLHTQKPSGMFLTLDGPEPSGVAFVAVTDFGKVLQKLIEQAGTPQDIGGGIRKLSLPNDVYFKEQGGWVFVTNRAEYLANLPADPSRTLGGLPQKYAVAVEVNAASIPAPLKEMAIGKMKEGFEESLKQQLANAPAESRELIEGVRRHGLDSVLRFFRESEKLTVGWAVDAEQGKTFLELDFTASAGTQLADQMTRLKDCQSSFTGFLLPDAAFTFHVAAPIAADDVGQLDKLIRQLQQQALDKIENDPNLRDENARNKIKDAFGELLDVARETLKTGRLNGGASVVLSPGAVQFVAGGLVADGPAVEQALREIVEVARHDPEFPQVSFDAETYEGVDLHTLSIPIPPREEDARKLLGEQLAVVLGTGARSFYLAFGRDCVALLKQVIHASKSAGPQTVPPMQLNVAVKPILDLAAAMEDNPAVQLMAEALKDASGKDHIRVTARAIERGVSYRLEVEEGVLQLIGQAAKMQGTAPGDR